MADEEEPEVPPLQQIEMKYAPQLEALTEEYSDLTAKMSQLGATFNEELASLKAENTPETYFKIDSLHVKSRVRRNIYEELLQSTNASIERVLIAKAAEIAAAEAAMAVEVEE